jgi:hypothetical protein
MSSSSGFVLEDAVDSGPLIVVAPHSHMLVQLLRGLDRSFDVAVDGLTHEDSHLIHSLRRDAPIMEGGTGRRPRSVVICTGKTPVATLYSSYSLLESLGARFHLHGDVLPAPNASLTLPEPGFSRTFIPRFSRRGLQPFHDFPMGPDFWQPQFWRALATNMGKMKLNYWGFHTYPLGPSDTNPAIAEPLVWVGPTNGFNGTTGEVFPSAAYETSWYQTEDFFSSSLADPSTKIRGNVPGQQSVPTSAFCCGASLLFERDNYGSAAQAAIGFPRNATAAADVLNAASTLIRDAFAWATEYAGVQGAIGVEFPLQLPQRLVKRNVSLLAAYQGMFGRIVASKQNISTFWLWTTEDVEDHGTGKGLNQSNPMWAALISEIHIAQQALKNTRGATFNLGTNGWTVGPGDNATFFDKEIADGSFHIAAINGALGWLPPDPAFGEMDGSRATVIPWMEDDLSLAGAIRG